MPEMSALLALRSRVPDATLLDWAELAERLPPPPCDVRRGQLERLWHVGQAALWRRLQRLAEAGLLDYEQRYGMVTIRRLGPAGSSNVTDCDGAPMVVSC